MAFAYHCTLSVTGGVTDASAAVWGTHVRVSGEEIQRWVIVCLCEHKVTQHERTGGVSGSVARVLREIPVAVAMTPEERRSW